MITLTAMVVVVVVVVIEISHEFGNGSNSLFLCLMAYQPLWVIQYQSHPCRRTMVVLFNLSLGVWKRGFIPFPRVLAPK